MDVADTPARIRQYLAGLIRCRSEGLCDAVGVSNFNADRIRRAVRTLGAEGIPLASNQVQYSLLYRAPEKNGVYEAVRPRRALPRAVASPRTGHAD